MIKIIGEEKRLLISGIKRTFLKCICPECGNTFMARQDHISRKHKPIKGCGCLRTKQTGRLAYNAKPEGMAAAKNVYNSYKGKCLKRNIQFDISFEEFLEITKRNCFYCNTEPSQSYSDIFKNGVRAGQKKVNGAFIYNGIDRIDNRKGYVSSNMRPCCRFCNSAKLDRSEEEFMQWINRLIKWRSSNNDNAAT